MSVAVGSVEGMTKDVLIYTFDTMADWEFAHISTVLAGSARRGDDRFQVRFVAETPDPVRTLGGLRAVPDSTFAEVDLDQVAMLVLPGGQTWGEGHATALATARACIDRGIPVAGICMASVAMARAGLVEHHAHVCDSPEDHEDYPGVASRVHGVVVGDDPVITAIGEAPLEFAREVFIALGLDTQEEIDRWYASFKDVPDAR